MKMATDRRHRSAPRPLDNERGLALVIVLAVVALLTILVTEFTFNTQLDQHRTRNAIHAMQAQLLARSGINLAEGFLMLDEEPAYDAYTEDWFPQMVEFCRGIEVDPTMRIRCTVRDESGKININNTREPRRRVESRRSPRAPSCATRCAACSSAAASTSRSSTSSPTTGSRRRRPTRTARRRRSPTSPRWRTSLPLSAFRVGSCSRSAP
jgi:hypothetical protein